MLKYFIFFTLAGFAAGYLIKNTVSVVLIILATSILWGLMWSPDLIWGLAVLGEMSLGYFISIAVKKSQASD